MEKMTKQGAVELISRILYNLNTKKTQMWVILGTSKEKEVF